MQWTEETFLSQKRWFHGTKKEYAVDIIVNGPNVNKNRHNPSDFGKGLYLCPNKEWSLSYIKKRFAITDEDGIIEDNDGIVIEFYFEPLRFLNYRHKCFDAMSEDFAKTVYNNWRHPIIPHFSNFNSFIFGPMSDGKQLYLMTALKNHEMSRTEVMKELLLPKEDWQLVIKNQNICNQLKIVKTYNLKGDEVHVI